MWYDVLVAAVLIVCMVRGAMRGVIWQLAGIAGLVLCLVFAETISAAVGPHVGLAEPLNHWVVMFAAYLVFSFLSFGVARLIHGWMEKAQMTEFNRHLGAVFGLIKGVAVCLVLTFFIVTLSPDMRTMLQYSKTGYAAAVIMDRLHPVMPEKLHDALEDYIHQLDAPEFPLQHSHDHAHHHAHGTDAHSDDPADSGPLAEDGGPWDWNIGESESIDPVDEIVKRIPGAGREQARSLIEQAYHSAPPELKADLIDELKTAAPSMILAVAGDWLNQAARPTAVDRANPNGPQGLIDAIASGYAAAPAERQRMVREIEESIRGLPDNITLGVLRDWRADLTGEGADPDPQTSLDTPVDQRIIRQLTIQRVSVYRLSQALQDRLRAAAQR